LLRFVHISAGLRQVLDSIDFDAVPAN
jgi:hypothetical protein